MPNRYVREAAIKSKSVNMLSWQAEVFWRRLLNLVDDFGRYHADPELLRIDVFPRQLDKVRVADIERLIDECEKAVLLFRYSSASKPYLVMNQWERGRAQYSDYPEPPANISKQLKSTVYKGKQVKADTPDSDSDSDPDSNSDPAWMLVDPFKSAWKEWKLHRKEIRHKLTNRTARMQLNTLSKWGSVKSVAMINLSIQNGWQGLFDRVENQNSPPPAKLGWVPDATYNAGDSPE